MAKIDEITTTHVKNFNINKEKISNIQTIKQFKDSVISDAFIDTLAPDYFMLDLSFISHFFKLFTDFKVVMTEDDENTIDVQKTYAAIRELGFDIEIFELPDVIRLKTYIEKEVENKMKLNLAYLQSSTATDNAIKDFSIAMNKMADLFETVTNQVIKHGDKFGKLITSKRVVGLINDSLKKIGSYFNIGEETASE